MSHANVCFRQKQLVPPGSAVQNKGCRSFQKPRAALTKEDHTDSSHSQKGPGRLFDYYLQGSLARNVGTHTGETCSVYNQGFVFSQVSPFN